MDLLVANVNDVVFDVETALDEQLGTQSLPFAGMDKSMSGVCTFFAAGNCRRGDLCPYRHLRGDRAIVCKHWLRGLCKKGDNCEFLHEYDMTKMPECYFYAKFSSCHNKECPFLHIDPETKVKDCPWYDRGFCRHGPLCRNRHVRRVLCSNYLAGFCPAGKDCPLAHPRFELPRMEDVKPASKIVCHFCRQTGHKAYQCPNNTAAAHSGLSSSGASAAFTTPDSGVKNNHQSFGRNEALDCITCFKCGKVGHISSNCTAVHNTSSQLSFLSSITASNR